MAIKQNPLLARYEAQAEARARDRYNKMLDIHSEIDLIAHLLSVHEDLGVGPGRAERVLNGFLESKLEVAEAISKECDEDEQGEFCKTQRDLAATLKSILGPAKWEKYKYMFPMLQSYWDLV